MKEIPLPMGWIEATPTSHRDDTGTPEEEWKETAHPKHPRTEMRCWHRGGRYVRVCEVRGDKHKYAVHRGWLDNEDSDEIHCSCDDKDGAIREANKLMRIGGTP